MAQTVLRGRSDAMSRALTALRRASSTGQGALVVISGEPGIGKSAVMREIVEQASRSGFAVGSGKAEQGDQIAPGAPLLVALRSETVDMSRFVVGGNPARLLSARFAPQIVALLQELAWWDLPVETLRQITGDLSAEPSETGLHALIGRTRGEMTLRKLV